jgi:hypothetical protein
MYAAALRHWQYTVVRVSWPNSIMLSLIAHLQCCRTRLNSRQQDRRNMYSAILWPHSANICQHRPRDCDMSALGWTVSPSEPCVTFRNHAL